MQQARDAERKLIGAYETDRRPGRDHRPDQTVGPAVGHVRREGRRDPRAEQPAGQGRDRDPVPRRVQHDHRTGVHQPVDRGGLEPGGDSGLAVCPDDGVGVPLGDVRRDARHGDHGYGGGEADGAVDAACQGRGRVIIAQRAVGAEPAADCFGTLVLLGGSANRTEIGPGETGAEHGLLLRDRLGGIWEGASGANRPEPVPTELKQSL